MSMKLNINSRGNGACPLCREIGRCSIHKAIQNCTEGIKDPKQLAMELVIYTCPYFKEKF